MIEYTIGLRAALPFLFHLFFLPLLILFSSFPIVISSYASSTSPTPSLRSSFFHLHSSSCSPSLHFSHPHLLFLSILFSSFSSAHLLPPHLILVLLHFSTSPITRAYLSSSCWSSSFSSPIGLEEREEEDRGRREKVRRTEREEGEDREDMQRRRRWDGRGRREDGRAEREEGENGEDREGEWRRWGGQGGGRR